MRFKNRRENKAKKFLIFLLIVLIIGIGAFVFFSPIFEKNSPKMSIKDDIYWNLISPLKINFSDDNEIKNYEITYIDEKNQLRLDTQVINSSKGSIDLNIIAPKLFENYVPQEAVLKIEVSDTSKWNFFMGNKLQKEVKLKIDRKKPIANVLSNTYMIKQGGSAVVVAEINDDNLKDMYISFNDEERFELIPYHKENFFVSIIAWPIDIKEFKGVNLIAIDEADNKTVTKVPLYIKYLEPKIDNLKISDDFIENVSKIVLEKSSMDIPVSPEDIFVAENKNLREKNVNTIRKVAMENMNNDLISKVNINTFKRLPSSMTFASYGERRHYFYKGKKIDEAWHLGADWASVKKAKIFTSNDGKVIFNDYLGIYGNTVIIDHGFGLATLYAHTSRSNVTLNQEVKAGDYIANTGSTGAVFGDHLHFGVLVQGIEVNPDEWMSKFWVRENITKIIENAMKVVKK